MFLGAAGSSAVPLSEIQPRETLRFARGRLRSSLAMKRLLSKRLWIGVLLPVLIASPGGAEGIPEPPLVWYGSVRNNVGGQDIRLTTGTLSWVIRDAQGGVTAALTLPLTNINDQFSYVVEIPCESLLGTMTRSPGSLLVEPPSTYSRLQVTLDGQPLFLQAPAGESFLLNGGTRGSLERIDLTFARTEPDADGDGLPDWWEDEYFPGVGADPAVDSDGDGVINRDEYLAGTNPTDPASLFMIEVTTDVAGFPRVRWSSAEGKSYRVLRAKSLSSNPADFVEVWSGIGATPPTNQLLDTTATDEGPYFYLLQVEE